MYWKYGFEANSSIDTLLDRANVTLEQVLDEDELLQEFKAQNSKLINFIGKPENIEKLINYVVRHETPKEGKAHCNPFTYPYIATELFACEVWVLCDSIVSNAHLLNTFFAFLFQPPPLHPLRASYFVKVAKVLIKKKTGDLLKYVMARTSILDALLTHIATSAINDLLIQIITCEATVEGKGILEWLHDQRLIQRLTAMLSPNTNSELQFFAAQALSDIISISQTAAPTLPSIGSNHLIEDLKSEENLTTLFQYITATEGSNMEASRRWCLEILNDVIIRNVEAPSAASEAQSRATSAPTDGEFAGEGEFGMKVSSSLQMGFGGAQVTRYTYEPDLERPNLQPIVTFAASQLPKIATLLRTKPTTTAQTSIGGEALGMVRLRICEFLVNLLHIDIPTSADAFVQAGICTVIVDLFFALQWNNLLHTLAHAMFRLIFLEGDYQKTRPAIISILSETQLTKKITQAQRDNDCEVEQPRGVRLGHMGHITLISSAVLTLLAHHHDLVTEPSIQCFFDSEDWIEYTTKTLRETRRRDTAPLGGVLPAERIKLNAGAGANGEEEEEEDGQRYFALEEDFQSKKKRSKKGDSLASPSSRRGSILSTSLDSASNAAKAARRANKRKAKDRFGLSDMGKEGDQLARYMMHQIIQGLPDRLGDDDHTTDSSNDDSIVETDDENYVSNTETGDESDLARRSEFSDSFDEATSAEEDSNGDETDGEQRFLEGSAASSPSGSSSAIHVGSASSLSAGGDGNSPPPFSSPTTLASSLGGSTNSGSRRRLSGSDAMLEEGDVWPDESALHRPSSGLDRFANLSSGQGRSGNNLSSSDLPHHGHHHHPLMKGQAAPSGGIDEVEAEDLRQERSAYLRSSSGMSIGAGSHSPPLHHPYPTDSTDASVLASALAQPTYLASSGPSTPNKKKSTLSSSSLQEPPDQHSSSEEQSDGEEKAADGSEKKILSMAAHLVHRPRGSGSSASSLSKASRKTKKKQKKSSEGRSKDAEDSGSSSETDVPPEEDDIGNDADDNDIDGEEDDEDDDEI